MPKASPPAPACGALRGGARRASVCTEATTEPTATRRAFDLSPTEGRLFDQIDAVERWGIAEVAHRLGLLIPDAGR
ncbi:MAG: hypothetical protein AB7W28_05235 [Armatimonadota bacterium]